MDTARGKSALASASIEPRHKANVSWYRGEWEGGGQFYGSVHLEDTLCKKPMKNCVQSAAIHIAVVHLVLLLDYWILCSRPLVRCPLKKPRYCPFEFFYTNSYLEKYVTKNFFYNPNWQPLELNRVCSCPCSTLSRRYLAKSKTIPKQIGK